MDLLRLSEQMAKSKNPAKYHREFERAVKAGELVGVVRPPRPSRVADLVDAQVDRMARRIRGY